MDKTARLRGFRAVLAAFQRALGADAVIKATSPSSEDRTYSLDIRVGRRSHKLLAHWVGTGWPGPTYDTVSRLRRPWPRNHVLVARRFSSATRSLLRRVDANWLDQTGAARIVTSSGLLIHSEGTPTLPERDAPFRWTAVSADVAEAVLAMRQVPTLKELSLLTGWAQPAIGKALRAFDHQGWTSKVGPARGTGARRDLTQSGDLLENWAEFAAAEERMEYRGHTLMKDPLNYLEHELAPALRRLGRYAVSGWAGLQLAAPFLTSVPVLHVYVEASVFSSGLREALPRLGIRPVDDGARLVFWAARPAVFVSSARARSSSVRIVNPSRLYADLMTLGERGREAAEHARLELLQSTERTDRARADG